MAENSIVNEVGSAVAKEAAKDDVVKIDKWVYGGDSLARVNGRVVLAPFLLPGEEARLAITDDVHASLLEITQPSSFRIEPLCPLFTRCGGCHYQHASADFQLARKVEILREQLRRVGKIEFSGEIQTISGLPFGYRNRAQLHIHNGKLGFLAARSRKLVPLEGECPISSPRLNQAIAEMRVRLSDRKFPRFVQTLEVFTNETDVQVNVIDSPQPVAKSFYEWCNSVVALDYPTSHGNFRVSPHSFFQVNRFLIDQLVDEVTGNAQGDSALDLYSGVGLFAVPLAKRFKQVTAVESGNAAARDLEVNEERAQLSNISIYRARVEDYLRSFTGRPEVIVADPPRAGLGKAVTEQFKRIAAPRLTIVACDPATLARDLAALPLYRIERMTLVDLFPQTFHMETVVHLTLS